MPPETELLTGVTALLLSGVFLMPFLVHARAAVSPVLVGWALRCFPAAAQGMGLITLPESTADALAFQRYAEFWSGYDWPQLLSTFNPSNSYVYSWIGAILYKLLGVNPLVFHALNVFLGSLAVLLTYRLAREFMDTAAARTLCWLAALFPFAILYSAVLLREMAVIVPLMSGLLLTVRWVRTGALVHLAGAGGAFAVATLFHGGAAFALVGLALVCFRESFSSLVAMLVTFRVNPRLLLTGLLATALLAGSAVHAVTGGMRLSSIGNAGERLSGGVDSVIATQAENRTSGGAAYPDFVARAGITESAWALPVRIAYFLFSPFPWDIRSPGHVLGIMSSVAFMAMMVSIVKSRTVIASDRGMQAVLIIVGLLVLVFSLGTYNVGTAIRHRNKFFFALLALCVVPALKRKLNWHR